MVKRGIVLNNLFSKKSLKWSITGIAIIMLLVFVCLVEVKAASSSSKKTIVTASTNLNSIKTNIENKQNKNHTTGFTKNIVPNNSFSQSESEKDYLELLNIVLSKNWSVDKNSESILGYGIKDEKGENVGLINTTNFVDNFDLLTQMPNHSSVTKDEYIDIPLGKCRLITLDADNGTAASGITGTHDVYYAEIVIKDEIIYIISLTKNDKKAETKKQFIDILKNLSIK